MTIGFDNKNGYWKSTYSFNTMCFANINKRFVSFREVVQNLEADNQNICYPHTEGSLINTYFGNQSSSIIAVSFNDNTSNNKVFKSLSIEGGLVNESEDQINFFRANSDNSPDKIAYGGRLREKGGVLYGHVGSISRDTNANVSIVGIVTDIGEIESGSRDVKVLNADTSNITGGTLFFFMNATDNENYIYGTSLSDDSLTQQGLAAGTIVTYDDMNPDTDGWGIESSEDNLMENNVIKLKIGNIDEDSFEGYLDDGTIMLFAVTPSGINGEQPKGQYADAWFILPANGGFELNAINLNYETVSADHSK